MTTIPADRLDKLVARWQTVQGALAAGADQESYVRLSREFAELDIIASVVIGGGSLNGGKGGVAGTILGVFIMGILRNGCDIYGIPNYIQEIFIGLIIVAAVAVDQLRARSR